MILTRFLLALTLLAGAVATAPAQQDTWPVDVVGWSLLGPSPYDAPASVLGPPATAVFDPGFPPFVPSKLFAPSLVQGAYERAPDASKLVTTILEGGHITVQFDPPLQDDPLNWYGRDFIVFGNSMFSSIGYVGDDSSMESVRLKSGYEGNWDPMEVSVSQNGLTWHTFESLRADDFAPTQAFAWDWTAGGWGAAMDVTKPVSPAVSRGDFAGLTAAEAIDLYQGSAGGTAFDLADLEKLPADPSTGLRWARYVRISSNVQDEDGFVLEGEVDAVARVSHSRHAVSIGQAKLLPDGARVLLDNAVVTAGTFATGPWLYLQSGYQGIRVSGRIAERGEAAQVEGVLQTVDSERVLAATAWTGADPAEAPAPVLLSAAHVAGSDLHYDPLTGAGQQGLSGATALNNVGLLVSTWGRVTDVEPGDGLFRLQGPSGAAVWCSYPKDAGGLSPDPQFQGPPVGALVRVTGISSLFHRQSILRPLVRLLDVDDVVLLP